MSKFSTLLILSFLLFACSTPPAQPISTVSTAQAIPSLMIPTPPACTTVQIEPTPGANAPSLFVPESPTDHVRGAESPILTIMDYGDYQDVRSGQLAQVLEQLLKEHPKDIRVVSRIFPLMSINDKAALAAQAAEAAAEQNRFWE